MDYNYPALGSLLFYKSSGSFFDRAIEIVTGKYVHVAILWDKQYKIEMLGQGCAITPYIPTTVAAIWEPPNDMPLIVGALRWLHEQIGQPYGWNDVTEALDTGHHFYWLQTGHRDCSHLAYDFLDEAGYADVNKIASDGARVTPMMLANYLHVK